jgi:hypothetical protein
MKLYGKKVRITTGVITLSAIIAIGSLSGAVYKLVHNDKHTSISNNNEDDMNNENNSEELTYEELEQAFVNYYNNSNDKYLQELDENVYGYMAINNLTGVEIENIFGRNVPTTLELEKGLTNFFAKSFYNYTYATEPSKVSSFVRNEVERDTLIDVEEQLAQINEQQMNDELNEADIKALKQSIKDIMTNEDYSLGLKAYVANTICHAFELIVSDSKYAFSDAEEEEYHNYATDYECKTLAEQLVGARDDSLVEHGAEVATVTDDEAFIERLRSLITNLKNYPSSFVSLDEMIAREIISEIEAHKNSEGKTEHKSSEKSTKEEVSKDEMTKDEKKQAEADEKAIEDKIDESNEAKEKRAKDRGKKIEAAIQSVNNGIDGYQGISGYIYNELKDDATLDNDFKSSIRTKTRAIIRIADNKTDYKIFNDTYELLYNEDGTMTEMMQQMVINCIINGLTEYSKKSYISTEMAEKLEKVTGITNLVETLSPYGLIQNPQITVVPGLEGTYDPSTNYTKDANGNKVYVSPSPAPSATPSAAPTPTPVPGITYYPIPTPPDLDFSKTNSNVNIFENYCSINNAAVANDIANTLNYMYGKQAALNYLYEVRDIAVSYAQTKLEEVNGRVMSKC